MYKGRPYSRGPHTFRACSSRAQGRRKYERRQHKQSQKQEQDEVVVRFRSKRMGKSRRMQRLPRTASG